MLLFPGKEETEHRARMGLGPCPKEGALDGDGPVAGSGPWVCLASSCLELAPPPALP